MVVSWLVQDGDPSLRHAYEELIGSSAIVLSFQTVAELRFGALNRGWSELRRRRLERSIAKFTPVQSDDAMTTACAKLRDDCARLGHPLAAKVHDGDRWIAATAVRLGVPVVSHDSVFRNVPGLDLIPAATAGR
jgi:predicted nucleic acid-binding protein